MRVRACVFVEKKWREKLFEEGGLGASSYVLREGRIKNCKVLLEAKITDSEYTGWSTRDIPATKQVSR